MRLKSPLTRMGDRPAREVNALFWLTAVAIGLALIFSSTASDIDEQPALIAGIDALPPIIMRDELTVPKPVVVPISELEAPNRAGDVLADYWGAEWMGVEAALEAAGVDLDQPFELVPWDEARGNFESMGRIDGDHANGLRSSWLAWPSELSLEWLQTTYGGDNDLNNADWNEITAIADPYNLKLDQGIDEALAATDLAIETEWHSGRFTKAPFSTTGAPARTGRAFYASARGSSSWAVKMRLFSDDYPEIMQMHRTLRSQLASRDAAISAYVSSL